MGWLIFESGGVSMGMGRREVERQGMLWVATGDAAQGPRHVFYE